MFNSLRVVLCDYGLVILNAQKKYLIKVRKWVVKNLQFRYHKQLENVQTSCQKYPPVSHLEILKRCLQLSRG